MIQYWDIASRINVNSRELTIFYSLQYKPQSDNANYLKIIQEYIVKCKIWFLVKLCNPQNISTSDCQNWSYRTFQNLSSVSDITKKILCLYSREIKAQFFLTY